MNQTPQRGSELRIKGTVTHSLTKRGRAFYVLIHGGTGPLEVVDSPPEANLLLFAYGSFHHMARSFLMQVAIHQAHVLAFYKALKGTLVILVRTSA